MNRKEIGSVNPISIVDVGASGDIDPRWKSLTSDFRAILFEPDPRAYEDLVKSSQRNYVILNTALSDQKGEIDFFLCHKQEVSSVHEPNVDILKHFPDFDRFRVQKTERSSVDTLDNQLAEHNIGEVDFIKVDAQGHTLPILTGSLKTLDTVIGLELEVEFAKLYKEQSLFHEVDCFVQEKGFSLMDIKRYFWKRDQTGPYRGRKGQVIFGDVLYFKAPETLFQNDDFKPEKLIRAIYVYLAYGYADLGERLLTACLQKSILPEEVVRPIQQQLKSYQKSGLIPDFKGKDRIRQFILKFADLFSTNDWANGVDPRIGNRYR